ncbi:hypothetical protein BH23CHL5_BH23CHL5_06250 [soil metagenome]
MRTNRRSLILGGASAGLGLVAAGGLGAAFLLEERDPTVHILGSGNGLSLLVTNRGTRAIVLLGSNASEFGNALNRVRSPFQDRVDLLLLTGPSIGLAFAQRAVDIVQPRAIYSIGNPLRLLDAGIPVNRTLILPHRFSISDDASIVVPELPVSDSIESQSLYWSGRIEHDGKTVMFDSAGPSEARSAGVDPVSTWIRLRGRIEPAELSELRPQAFVIDADAQSGPELRQMLKNDVGYPVSAFRVHDGESARIRFRTTGLELPSHQSNDP